jgi:hypothetical protein
MTTSRHALGATHRYVSPGKQQSELRARSGSLSGADVFHVHRRECAGLSVNAATAKLVQRREEVREPGTASYLFALAGHFNYRARSCK